MDLLDNKELIILTKRNPTHEKCVNGICSIANKVKFDGLDDSGNLIFSKTKEPCHTKIEVIKKLGIGAYGLVFLVKYKGETKALKLVSLEQPYSLVSPLEVDIMRRIKQSNLMDSEEIIFVDVLLKAVDPPKPLVYPVEKDRSWTAWSNASGAG